MQLRVQLTYDLFRISTVPIVYCLLHTVPQPWSHSASSDCRIKLQNPLTLPQASNVLGDVLKPCPALPTRALARYHLHMQGHCLLLSWRDIISYVPLTMHPGSRERQLEPVSLCTGWQNPVSEQTLTAFYLGTPNWIVGALVQVGKDLL